MASFLKLAVFFLLGIFGQPLTGVGGLGLSSAKGDATGAGLDRLPVGSQVAQEGHIAEDVGKKRVLCTAPPVTARSVDAVEMSRQYSCCRLLSLFDSLRVLFFCM